MDIGWKLASAASLAVANIAAGQIVNVGWKAATGRKPPVEGEDAATATLLEVVLFGVISGVLIAVLQRFAVQKTNKWYGGRGKDMLAAHAKSE